MTAAQMSPTTFERCRCCKVLPVVQLNLQTNYLMDFNRGSHSAGYKVIATQNTAYLYSQMTVAYTITNTYTGYPLGSEAVCVC